MAANRKPQSPRPRPLAYARDVALLNLAAQVFTGFEVHVMRAGQTYAVLGDDAFSVVGIRHGAARCLTCKKSCLCAETVTMWRRRLKELGGKP